MMSESYCNLFRNQIIVGWIKGFEITKIGLNEGRADKRVAYVCKKWICLENNRKMQGYVLF